MVDIEQKNTNVKLAIVRKMIFHVKISKISMMGVTFTTGTVGDVTCV